MTDAYAGERPALTLTEAARAAGVDRRTLRRRLDAGELPNAYRDRGRQGPGTGPWLIPVGDLLAAGFTLNAPSPGPAHARHDDQGDELAELRHELDHLRERLARAERDRDVAQAVATERERTIAVQADHLRALQAGPPSSSQPTTPPAPLPPEPPASLLDRLTRWRPF